ncbi:hypothetical protein ACFL36_03165 [Thermodesulfobacteriota bacterium]
METIREAWKDFINYWTWNYRIDLHWAYELNISKAKALKFTKQYLNKLNYKHGFKFGAIIFIVLNMDMLPHAHILLISDPTFERNKILSTELLESISFDYSSSAKVKDVIRNREAYYLLTEKNLNLYAPDRLEWSFYRDGLLKHLKSDQPHDKHEVEEGRGLNESSRNDTGCRTIYKYIFGFISVLKGFQNKCLDLYLI